VHSPNTRHANIRLGRSFRKKPASDMTFPHPKSRKDKCGNEDEPSGRGVVGNLVKRAVNVADYRNSQDDMNPAANGTLSGITHMQVLLWFFQAELAGIFRVQPLPVAELHRVPTGDAADGSSTEKSI